MMKSFIDLNPGCSSWEFDSTTLAYNLTLIDRDLFLKVRFKALFKNKITKKKKTVLVQIKMLTDNTERTHPGHAREILE
jgi:hypothetical protein